MNTMRMEDIKPNNEGSGTVFPPDTQWGGRLQERRPKQKNPLRFFIMLALAAFFLVVGVLAVKAGITFNIISRDSKGLFESQGESLPVADPREYNRLDILFLGMRGEGDPYGGMLTDSLLLVSVKTDTGKIAMVSIPRDLYLTIPIVDKRAKINEAYELGQELDSDGGGLTTARLTVERATGVNIDYVAVVDFQAFKDVIDILGGVDVTVEKPLYENMQWGGIEFSIPKGMVRMDSDTALLYTRSRFTTSDFDRARRIQEVLIAMKNKALVLGFFTNPTKVYNVLDVVGKHVRTDVDLGDAPKFFELAKKADTEHITRLVLDTQSGLLYSDINSAGQYVLLPEGENFSNIHERVRGIFKEEDAP